MTGGVGKILLVCVAYHNYGEVQSFLASVLDQKKAGGIVDVIVVDNTWPSPVNPDIWLNDLSAETTSGRLQVIRVNGNLGYFGAFRAALSHAQAGNFNQYEWVIATNTDVAFETKEWVSVVEAFPEDAGVIAPKITSALSGKNQNPLYRFRPKPIKFALLSLLFRSYWLTAVYRRMAFAKAYCVASFAREQPSDVAVYAPHGSFLCFSRRYFARGGKFACETFLFCEEIFLAEELRKIGLSVLYNSELHVRHVEHSTTAFVPAAPIRRYLAEAHWASFKLLLKK